MPLFPLPHSQSTVPPAQARPHQVVGRSMFCHERQNLCATQEQRRLTARCNRGGKNVRLLNPADLAHTTAHTFQSDNRGRVCKVCFSADEVSIFRVDYRLYSTF
eukprot:3293900-Amphidinium_carterae.1